MLLLSVHDQDSAAAVSCGVRTLDLDVAQCCQYLVYLGILFSGKMCSAGLERSRFQAERGSAWTTFRFALPRPGTIPSYSIIVFSRRPLWRLLIAMQRLAWVGHVFPGRRARTSGRQGYPIAKIAMLARVRASSTSGSQSQAISSRSVVHGRLERRMNRGGCEGKPRVAASGIQGSDTTTRAERRREA